MEACDRGIPPAFPSHQAERIGAIQRIPPDIGKPISSAIQPNRIRLNVPPTARIVIPIDVVGQSAFLIQLLSGISQVEGHGRRATLCGSGSARLQVSRRSGGWSNFAEADDQPLSCDLPLCAGESTGYAHVIDINRVQAAVNPVRDLQDLSEGDTSEASTVLGEAFKAIHCSVKGVKVKSGIVIQNDADVASLLGQVGGFSPSDVRNAYKAT